MGMVGKEPRRTVTVELCEADQPDSPDSLNRLNFLIVLCTWIQEGGLWSKHLAAPSTLHITSLGEIHKVSLSLSLWNLPRMLSPRAEIVYNSRPADLPSFCPSPYSSNWESPQDFWVFCLFSALIEIQFLWISCHKISSQYLFNIYQISSKTQECQVFKWLKYRTIVNIFENGQ